MLQSKRFFSSKILFKVTSKFRFKLPIPVIKKDRPSFSHKLLDLSKIGFARRLNGHGLGTYFVAKKMVFSVNHSSKYLFYLFYN